MIGWLLAAALMASCSSGGGSSKPASRASTTPAEPGAPPASVGTPFTSGNPSDQRRRDAARSLFIRQANVACAAGAQQAPMQSPPDLHERAIVVSDEADTLGSLRRRLSRVQAPARSAKPFANYKTTLNYQIKLDRYIARAARQGDHQAVTVGMSENQHNRDRRTQLAKKLRLSRCLQDTSSAG
jgi:hypothetical protein